MLKILPMLVLFNLIPKQCFKVEKTILVLKMRKLDLRERRQMTDPLLID